ncbi:MAG: adenylate kinase [Anaerolineae bacterium]|nr:adenylate kinase [Anaerolineae bacterium]MBN8618637.1 adenylate kinase [Anaerolineae bacterium]
MPRIIIVGTSGAGKSVLGKQAAERLGVPFIDLDALFWLPNWMQVADEVFRERVQNALQPPHWVAAGNYSRARDLIWQRATQVVWLDYPLWLTQWRLFKRTVRRVVTQEDLWQTGNRESWRTQFFSRQSILLWAIQAHGRYRKRYVEVLQAPEYKHLAVLRFRRPSEASRWLQQLSIKEKEL